MANLIYSREEAYRYILATECGYTNEIGIAPELFEEFCLVGYIKQGMDGEWNERWHITDFGRVQIKSYLNFFDQENELKNLLTNLGIA